MAISYSPIVNPLRTTSPFTSSRFPPRRPFCAAVILCSYKSGSGLTAEDKKALFERYGFDPDAHQFSHNPSKTRRRVKQEKRPGKAKQVSEQVDEPQRETHKLLQVLGGKAKRKKLLSPKGMDVRPMMEVVKGSAFDILQAAGGCPASLRPGRWLDLYSGTGSVGIEAISRGCSEVHFVEMDPWVVSNVLQQNLEATGFLDVSVIHTVRVESFLQQAEQLLGGDRVFDFISVTPPYTQVNYEILMDQISKSTVIGEDTFIVVEYPLRTDMLESCGCLVKIKDRRFGRTRLAIYGPQWALKKRSPEKAALADMIGTCIPYNFRPRETSSRIYGLVSFHTTNELERIGVGTLMNLAVIT